MKYLTRPAHDYKPFAVTDPELLRQVLRPADVLLVEGNLRFSTAIKYLTQSTWSHAAIYVGSAVSNDDSDAPQASVIEADLENGVIAVPLSKYKGLNTRICRPVGLSERDCKRVVRYMVDSIGMDYDLKNVIDLARYLIRTPPVPASWRRRLLGLGSGDPTRVICSTRIAQAYQSVRYPILPHVEKCAGGQSDTLSARNSEMLRIRHHSLFVPRDFDLSPYFAVVKPTIETGFDYTQIFWND